ncbi:thiopurine S-methyltransferase [Luteimonas kalidii]|uniref:Thiopurine S-methyltransferase n=1 Tax=Luteimonas kalidii TaxID=3042025 RepID=A0ABT6JQG3_9GAMM|nr:thiopurine S-methyltransferase [Luteimonas kalidii]MDH5832928.1 thiopurine S-methyltransferase [Luteimonas kalidii]
MRDRTCRRRDERVVWHERWRSQRIGFHRDAPLPLLTSHWHSLGLPPDSRVCVPLCGKSLDMVWLAEQSHRVLGIELSDLAITQFFDERGLAPRIHTSAAGTHYIAGPWELLAGDAFAVPAALLADCAGVYDRAALIALPASMRATYAATTWSRLPAHCRGLLVTLEYPQHEKAGPPFSVGESEVQARFVGTQWSVALLERRDILAHEPSFQAEGVSALSTAVYRLDRAG